MLHFKILYNWVLAFLLFLTFTGFSEVSTYNENFKCSQTELVVPDTLDEKTTAKYCDVNLYKNQLVTVNHYTVFNFKSLLYKCHLNLSITFKTQKQRAFEFLNTNSILEQNLIAYTTTSPTNNAFVK